MKISKLLEKKKPLISFEVFPPKKEYSLDKIFENIKELEELDPDFFSVTYGAGGSTKDTTIDVVEFISKRGYNGLAHLTGITSNKEEIEEILDELKKKNIENILALRGDYPENEKDYKKDFKYASDLIKFIKSKGDFSIGAACYPEKHLESDSFEKDIEFLKYKVDCGVDFLVTQLFFDNNIFYKYLANFNKYKIDIPVIAGIFPVTNSRQVKRVLELTNCSFPEKFRRILYKFSDDDVALKEAGIAYATEQIIDLLSWGIDGIHIYTMNRPEVAKEIMRRVEKIRGALNETYKGKS